MLHRSFKPAKCKTALKLVVSRIKLLKSKRDAQVKQLKRELAELMQSGQEQTAVIRVEHVVRGVKTMAAYDLIEIYCELIAARLPIIDSQKTCPIDLKEAVSSVIYASPRCVDLQELVDIRKHLKAKYGKEFVTAALELRPDCGVSCMLVEKLSTKPPDRPTNIKTLSAIAEEYGIKWDPKALEEKKLKPPDDLPNVTNISVMAAKMQLESPEDQAPCNHDEKGPQSVRVAPSDNTKLDGSINFHRNNSGLLQSQNFTPDGEVDIRKATQNYCPEVRSLEIGAEGREVRDRYSGTGKLFSLEGQTWNLDFKDATAAAQAAAEAAERASMAAKAAAELSTRRQIASQYLKSSQDPSTYPQRNEGPQNYVRTKFQGEIPSELVGNDTSQDKYSRMQDNYIDNSKRENLTEESRRFNDNSLEDISRLDGSVSLNSDTATSTYGSSKNSIQTTDILSSKYSSKLERTEYASDVEYGSESNTINTFIEKGMNKQPSHFSSSSHTWAFGNDQSVLNHKRDCAADGPFVQYEQEKYKMKAVETDDHERKSIVFDDSGSEDDDGHLYEVMNDQKGHPESSQRIIFDAEPEENFEGPLTSSSSRLLRHLSDSNETDAVIFDDPVKYNKHERDSDSESGKEINLGLLRGGLRNKGYRLPTYIRNSYNDASDKQNAGGTAAKMDQSPSFPAQIDLSGTSNQEPHNHKVSSKCNIKTSSKVSVKDPDSYNGDSDEDFLQQTSGSTQQSYVSKADTGISERSRKAQFTYFDSDTDDSEEEDLQKEKVTSKVSSTTAFSRRTKPSSIMFGSSPLKAKDEESPSLDCRSDEMSFSKSPGTPSKFSSQDRNSDY